MTRSESVFNFDSVVSEFNIMPDKLDLVNEHGEEKYDLKETQNYDVAITIRFYVAFISLSNLYLYIE